MRITLSKNFGKGVKGRFGKYNFEVGILQDGPHKVARRGKKGLKGQDVLSNYAGGPVRKKSNAVSGTISQVSKQNQDRLGVNFYTAPFKKKSSDIIKFTKSFFDLAFGRSQKRRAENLLQAVVRNPILRGEYGVQSALTTKIKGFNRPMMDTAQLFRAITAVCRVRGV